MKRLIVWSWLALTLLSTSITIPLLQYQTVLYGSQFVDVNFIIEYIQTWWQKIIRRATGQYGPAEIVIPNETDSYSYALPTTKTKVVQPSNIYELIEHLEKNSHEYSEDILSYLKNNAIPNKSVHIDLLVIPENIYITFYWDKSELSIYEGWEKDKNANEYLEAIATSDLLMDLYQNRADLTECRSLLLQADGNGSLKYTIKRLNPIEVASIIPFIQIGTFLIALSSLLITIRQWRKH